MDYYSKFDWENYCISLNGPVCQSSLPDIVGKQFYLVPLKLWVMLLLTVLSLHSIGVGSISMMLWLYSVCAYAVENPDNGGADLMFDEEFLKNCMDMFSVSSTALETNSRAFPKKYINIIDPLKENNNLGRSVHRGREFFSLIYYNMRFNSGGPCHGQVARKKFLIWSLRLIRSWKFVLMFSSFQGFKENEYIISVTNLGSLIEWISDRKLLCVV